MKKILVVDDSALMRSVICDIISSDKRFRVEDRAINGLEALKLLRRKQYDAVVLDINMPVMDGIELLKELRREQIAARVLIASTDSRAGAKITLEALELGALDFIENPGQAADLRVEDFKKNFLELLDAVSGGKSTLDEVPEEPVKPIKPQKKHQPKEKPEAGIKSQPKKEILPVIPGKKIVAIASSTGGPKALQAVIPLLPETLDAPVLIVQHMPKGFTASFAERLDSLSKLSVAEAKEGDILQDGQVYLAMGGLHMNVVRCGDVHKIHYSDEPTREGVKPCANYMYESLADCGYEEVICVVLTGMGADGTEGIKNLKMSKKTYVIAQNQESCAVYGMPKSVVNAGITDKVLELKQVAREITLYTGVRENGCKPIS